MSEANEVSDGEQPWLTDAPRALTEDDIGDVAAAIAARLAKLPYADQISIGIGTSPDHPGELVVQISDRDVAGVLLALTESGYPNRVSAIDGVPAEVAVHVIVSPKHDLVLEGDGRRCARCGLHDVGATLMQRCDPDRMEGRRLATNRQVGARCGVGCGWARPGPS